MEKKSASYGLGFKTSQVVYIIQDKVVYFHQNFGIYSSINGAHEIMNTISRQENIDPREYRWIDIQTTPRYSSYDQCEIIRDINTPGRIDWITTDVPEEILKILLEA